MSTMSDLWRRVSGRGGSGARDRRVEIVTVDPLDTLAVQVRLTELAAEVRHIEDVPGLYARAHHWRAAVLAYDAALRDACRLAGIEPATPATPMDADAPRVKEERLREELELSAHGWSW